MTKECRQAQKNPRFATQEQGVDPKGVPPQRGRGKPRAERRKEKRKKRRWNC